MKCSLLAWFIFDTLEKTVVVFLYCFAIFPRVPIFDEVAVDIELLMLLWFVSVPYFPQKLKLAYISAPHVTPKETILNLFERVTWAA